MEVLLQFINFVYALIEGKKRIMNDFFLFVDKLSLCSLLMVQGRGW